MCYHNPMGLMYVFPATEDETDRIVKSADGAICLKTYGLPLVFWGYLSAILAVIFLLFIAVKEPLSKVLSGTDQINKLIAVAVLLLLFGLPIILICFYFYEKRILKEKRQITISHHIFGLKIYRKNYLLESEDAFLISHLLDSPNVARIEGEEAMRGFQNKGYFELHFKTDQGSLIFLDRHSRKADLNKIKTLLSDY